MVLKALHSTMFFATLTHPAITSALASKKASSRFIARWWATITAANSARSEEACYAGRWASLSGNVAVSIINDPARLRRRGENIVEIRNVREPLVGVRKKSG